MDTLPRLPILGDFGRGIMNESECLNGRVSKLQMNIWFSKTKIDMKVWFGDGTSVFASVLYSIDELFPKCSL